MDSKELRLLGEAYASIQEGYDKKKEEKDCVSKSEKGEHNCAKKVCHESFGEGTCIFGEHAVPDENGFVSHYDVMFEHGIERNIPVADMEVLEEGSHNEENHRYEGDQIDEQRLSGPQRRARQAQQQAAAAQSRQQQGQALQSFANRGGLLGAFGRALETRRQEVAAKRQLSQDVAASRAQAARLGDAPARETGMPRPAAPVVAAKPAPAPVAKPAGGVVANRVPSTSVAGTFKPVAGAPTQASLATARPAPEKANILGNKASELAARQAKAKADSLAQAAKNRARGQRPMSARERMLNQDLDLFDIVKGYLLDEGATEEEALKRMSVMTEEERNEIIESSCGSGHSKKKKKKSGY
jgi:hypothetical protein